MDYFGSVVYWSSGSHGACSYQEEAAQTYCNILSHQSHHIPSRLHYPHDRSLKISDRPHLHIQYPYHNFSQHIDFGIPLLPPEPTQILY